MSEPTDEQIRRVLAEFEGYTHLVLSEISHITCDDDTVFWWFGRTLGKNWRVKTPDYLNDLNAMHRIERELDKRELQDAYFDALHDVVTDSELRAWEMGHGLHKMMAATARQRALAAYRTTTEYGQEGKSDAQS